MNSATSAYDHATQIREASELALKTYRDRALKQERDAAADAVAAAQNAVQIMKVRISRTEDTLKQIRVP